MVGHSNCIVSACLYLDPGHVITAVAYEMTSSSTHNQGNRSAILTEQDLDTLSALRHEKSTKTATRFGSNVFREWLQIRGHSPEFKDVDYACCVAPCSLHNNASISITNIA